MGRVWLYCMFKSAHTQEVTKTIPHDQVLLVLLLLKHPAAVAPEANGHLFSNRPVLSTARERLSSRCPTQTYVNIGQQLQHSRQMPACAICAACPCQTSHVKPLSTQSPVNNATNESQPAEPQPPYGGGGKPGKPGMPTTPPSADGPPPVSEGKPRGAWPGKPGITMPAGNCGMPGMLPLAPSGCTEPGTGGSWPGLIHSPAAARV